MARPRFSECECGEAIEDSGPNRPLLSGGSKVSMDGTTVTSRTVVRVFLEQFWFEFVPVLHRLQGGPATQSRLRELLVVEPAVAMQRGFQFLA